MEASCDEALSVHQKGARSVWQVLNFYKESSAAIVKKYNTSMRTHLESKRPYTYLHQNKTSSDDVSLS